MTQKTDEQLVEDIEVLLSFVTDHMDELDRRGIIVEIHIGPGPATDTDPQPRYFAARVQALKRIATKGDING